MSLETHASLCLSTEKSMRFERTCTQLKMRLESFWQKADLLRQRDKGRKIYGTWKETDNDDAARRLFSFVSSSLWWIYCPIDREVQTFAKFSKHLQTLISFLSYFFFHVFFSTYLIIDMNISHWIYLLRLPKNYCIDKLKIIGVH